MSMLKKLTHISSRRLQYLLEQKASGRITEPENVELATYAENFANIILRTPKKRRYLKYNDPYGNLDLENQMRANVQIVILGTCPYTYDASAGSAYSYCLFCANSAVCEVMRMNNRHTKCIDTCRRVIDLFGRDLFPAKKICTSHTESAI